VRASLEDSQASTQNPVEDREHIDEMRTLYKGGCEAFREHPQWFDQLWLSERFSTEHAVVSSVTIRHCGSC
jgi:hypothetical protein